MVSGKHNPVLMIGLDAAEVTLIERWMDDGSLPNLRRIRDQGAFGRLGSTAQWLVGSPWPSFYTGTPPEEHGMYHYLVWRPDRMATARPQSDWMPLRPFWRRSGDFDRRAIVIDVPLVYAPGEFNGQEISGWAIVDTLEPPASHPAQLINWASGTFSRPSLDDKQTYTLSARERQQIRDGCIQTTNHVVELALELLGAEAWDLFLVCFSATHRAGHQLWDLTNLAGDASPAEDQDLQSLLKEVYVACDDALGRLIEAAGDDVTTLVFSVHGMGANLSRVSVLREMLDRIVSPDTGSSERSTMSHFLERFRSSLPVRWRNQIKNHLPMALQDRLTLFWRTSGIDWSSTRAFAPFGDQEGYVRINLRGREAAGIVEPGAEYDALLAEITEGLLTFTDEETGQPVVAEVDRADRVFPDGQKRHLLPDLIIRWSPQPAASHRRISSPRHGSISWPTPGHNPQGHCGNHGPLGLLFAKGERIPPGASLSDGHILDLAPTVYSLLDLEVPDTFKGRALF